MKKKDSSYILSDTDRKRIAAKARAFARSSDYDGHIEAWFFPDTGKLRYCEIVGLGCMDPGESEAELIYSAPCRKK